MARTRTRPPNRAADGQASRTARRPRSWWWVPARRAPPPPCTWPGQGWKSCCWRRAASPGQGVRGRPDTSGRAAAGAHGNRCQRPRMDAQPRHAMGVRGSGGRHRLAAPRQPSRLRPHPEPPRLRRPPRRSRGRRRGAAAHRGEGHGTVDGPGRTDRRGVGAGRTRAAAGHLPGAARGRRGRRIGQDRRDVGSGTRPRAPRGHGRPPLLPVRVPLPGALPGTVGRPDVRQERPGPARLRLGLPPGRRPDQHRARRHAAPQPRPGRPARDHGPVAGAPPGRLGRERGERHLPAAQRGPAHGLQPPSAVPPRAAVGRGQRRHGQPLERRGHRTGHGSRRGRRRNHCPGTGPALRSRTGTRPSPVSGGDQPALGAPLPPRQPRRRPDPGPLRIPAGPPPP